MRKLIITTLPNGRYWVDRDTEILHACFQILEDFVEKENPFEHSDSWAKSHAGKTCKELYDWWQERKLKPTADWDLMAEDDKQLMRLMKIRTTLWT